MFMTWRTLTQLVQSKLKLLLMNDNLHGVICWANAYLEGIHKWSPKLFLWRFDNSALQVCRVVFQFLLCLFTYLKILPNIKLNNLGNVRIP
jgi:hypothetical protein